MESASNKLSDPQYLHLLCQLWHPVSIVTEQSMQEKDKEGRTSWVHFHKSFSGLVIGRRSAITLRVHVKDT